MDLQDLRRQLTALLGVAGLAAARVATGARDTAAARCTKLVSQFWVGRQAGGDCLASLLPQVLGVKGKQPLETGFAAHPLPLLPGGRGAHGEAGGVGGSRGSEGGRGEERREGLKGMEWEEYVWRLGEIIGQGGLAGEQYRYSCSQCSEDKGAEGRANGAMGDPPGSSGSSNANSARGMSLSSASSHSPRAAAFIFSNSAASRHKESVEEAAVEEALHRFSGGREAQRAGECRIEGSEQWNQTHQQQLLLLQPSGPQVQPRDPTLQVAPGKCRFGAAPKLPSTTGSEGSAVPGWKEFLEGDRAAVAVREKDPEKFMGIKTLHVGAFQGDEVDKKEVKKEHNVRELNLPSSSSHTNRGSGYTLEENTSGPYFPTLGHHVEEFLRRFAPARLAREGRNGPLAHALTS
ncbi:unnamed protein product [Closterium sp. NIES-64]|nr:unnamed protein product [Closterium sp. NIES-64]